jgi:hypothetical protein
MLPSTFVDWWFAPWRDGVAAPQPEHMRDRLGQRDGYRLWCAQARIAPDLPARFDPAWHAAASAGPQLLATARLYAGLIAAREHDTGALAALPPEQRLWCLRTASTQPLARCGHAAYDDADTLEARGLAELACHLEHGFPGLWPRLRLALPAGLNECVAQLLAARPEHAAMPDPARPQRCWQMCRRRCDDAA